MSTTQIAKLVAIARDFDDTDPDPNGKRQPAPEFVNTDLIIPLSGYSKGRTTNDEPDAYMSDADRARLDVLIGGGEWIEVSAEDMAAAR